MDYRFFLKQNKVLILLALMIFYLILKILSMTCNITSIELKMINIDGYQMLHNYQVFGYLQKQNSILKIFFSRNIPRVYNSFSC